MEYIRHLIETNDGKMMYLFIILNIAMIFDVISGVISAYLNKEQQSKLGINGLLRKSLIFMVTLLLLLGCALIPQGTAFVVMTLSTLILMEVQSIIENIGKCKMSEYEFLKKRLSQLPGKKEDVKDEDK